MHKKKVRIQNDYMNYLWCQSWIFTGFAQQHLQELIAHLNVYRSSSHAIAGKPPQLHIYTSKCLVPACVFHRSCHQFHSFSSTSKGFKGCWILSFLSAWLKWKCLLISVLLCKLRPSRIPITSYKSVPS